MAILLCGPAHQVSGLAWSSSVYTRPRQQLYSQEAGLDCCQPASLASLVELGLVDVMSPCISHLWLVLCSCCVWLIPNSRVVSQDQYCQGLDQLDDNGFWVDSVEPVGCKRCEESVASLNIINLVLSQFLPCFSLAKGTSINITTHVDIDT